MQILVPVVLLALMYVMLIRPQQQRARKQRELLSTLEIGDRILTVGGLLGTIVGLNLETVDVEAADGERFDGGIWDALAEANLLGVALPTDVGGSGLGIIEQCLVLEQVGRTVAPVPVCQESRCAPIRTTSDFSCGSVPGISAITL